MTDEITFPVSGYPPAKSEALSMLGVDHRHADRVVRLLKAAHARIAATEFGGFGPRPIALALVVRCPRDGSRSDATNYCGGVADVLEDKGYRGVLDHLGELAHVALYDNDRQIEAITYRWEDVAAPSYEVRLWALDSGEEPVDAGADLKAPDPGTLTESAGEDRFTRKRLQHDGFVGWMTFDQLRQDRVAAVPEEGGVYVVARANPDKPAFLDTNPAGRFKGRNPTVDAATLEANWVDAAEVVYIGKANSLKRRLREFQRFGSGAPIGHWGGRLIWQLAASVELQVAWKPAVTDDPRALLFGPRFAKS